MSRIGPLLIVAALRLLATASLHAQTELDARLATLSRVWLQRALELVP
jgi:hypothetical protein